MVYRIVIIRESGEAGMREAQGLINREPATSPVFLSLWASTSPPEEKIQLDAVTQLLIEKGIITEEEFFMKLKQVQAEYVSRRAIR